MADDVAIQSRDFWFKVVDMLQQNWALIEAIEGGVTVFFIHDASGVFDRLQIASQRQAEVDLRRNGFRRYAEDEHSHQFITPPSPPFRLATHPNGPIYSSGRFWK